MYKARLAWLLYKPIGTGELILVIILSFISKAESSNIILRTKGKHEG